MAYHPTPPPPPPPPPHQPQYAPAPTSPPVYPTSPPVCPSSPAPLYPLSPSPPASVSPPYHPAPAPYPPQKPAPPTTTTHVAVSLHPSHLPAAAAPVLADDNRFAYGLYGFIAGFFLSILAFLFLLCQCNAIHGRRKPAFIVGAVVGILLDAALWVVLWLVVWRNTCGYYCY